MNKPFLILCVNCGKAIPWADAKGSLKQPYCAKCFNLIFGGSYQRYREVWKVK